MQTFPIRTLSAVSALGALLGWFTPAMAAEAPLLTRTQNASAPSFVYRRGDLEILTFEPEADYQKLEELFKASQESKPAPGPMTTRYYRSGIDGSVQPYGIWLPRDFSSEKKYPLVIQLHGTNFREVLSGTRQKFRGMPGPQWVEPDLPMVYAQACGGPTTFYQGMGEVDVMSVIEEVKRLVPIDPEQIYIMGHSMGGAGSFTVGLHYPDHFGGIMCFDPAMGPHAAAIPDDLPKWMEPQVNIVSPAKLAPNGRNVDVFFKNAGAGIQRNSTEYADGIVAEGGFATTEVLPGMPHSFGVDYHNAGWITELTLHPIRRHPAQVKFYSNTLQYNHAYWVTIDRLTRHNADALVTATCTETSVEVSTSNLDALTLRLNEAPAAKGASIKLVVDRHEVLPGNLPDLVHLTKQGGEWKVGEWTAPGPVKHHGLQGPIGDAFNSPFLAVYGEGNRDLAIAELDAVRNPPGPLDIQSEFPMKAAAKVTAEDIKSSNLILFGTPESNVVLKRLAPSLPPELLKTGVVFIHPNPENPERYILVWNAKLLSVPDLLPRAGWIMPLSLLPDYIQVENNQIVAGGHFDNDWKKDPAMYFASTPGAPVAKPAPTPAVVAAAPPAPAPIPRATGGGFGGGTGGGGGARNFQNGGGRPAFGNGGPPLLTDAQREAMRVEQQKYQDESAKVTENIRLAEQELKAAVLAEPCDPKLVQAKAEALAKLQAVQTVDRIKAFPVVASTLTEDQRERIQNATTGSLQFMLSGFGGGQGGPPGGGRFQGGGQGGPGRPGGQGGKNGPGQPRNGEPNP